MTIREQEEKGPGNWRSPKVGGGVCRAAKVDVKKGVRVAARGLRNHKGGKMKLH